MRQPKSRPSFADHVYNALYGRISNGEYAPEQKLPPETALAAELGVSRPVLREALERLRDEGLVMSRQGAGNYVRPGPATPLGYGRIETIADIQRCYEFRLTVEPQAARLAAERRNEQSLADLSAALGLLKVATSSMLHREDADFTFHLAVARAANNTYFEATLRALNEQVSVGMRLHGQSLLRDGLPGLQSVLDEHAGIFDAIRLSQPEVAAERMDGHIRRSQERLFGGALIDLRLPAPIVPPKGAVSSRA
ncbi:MAG: FadR/GntR family transcriptional regulator [Paracoccus sp. (in: a-proteobacteria)]